MKIKGTILLSMAMALTACGGGGGNSTSTAPPVSVNRAPQVTIADISANEKTSVSLAAVASDADGDTLSFTWSQTAGQTVDFTSNDDTISFTAPDISANIDLNFTVMVSDGVAQTSANGIVSVVNINEVPIANAGEDQGVPQNIVVSLSGSGTDSDGSIESFEWRQLSGNLVSLEDSAKATASFTDVVLKNRTVC